MAAALLFAQPFFHAKDANGTPLVGAELTVFIAGSSTPSPVYTSSALNVAWTQPIVTNAAGNSTGPIFCNPTPSLKIVVVDADGVAVPGFPIDNVTPYELAS